MSEQSHTFTVSRLANVGARAIHDTFQQYRLTIAVITQRANGEFIHIFPYPRT